MPVSRTHAPADLSAHSYDLDRRELTRLTWSLFSGFTVMYAAYAGLASVLMPAQVSFVDPDNKEASHALIMSASAFVTIFIQPIFGAISDRTRSRWGRRTPWMCLGVVGGALALLVIGHLEAVALLLAAWIAVQVLINIMQIPMTAWLPDRVAPERRGIVSSFIGVGTQVGATVGIVLATRFAEPGQVATGYTVFAVLLVVVILAIVLLNADKDDRGVEVAPFSWRAFARGFWVSPRQAPDFWWAFAARVVLILGYWGVFTYTRYSLEDYFKVGDQVNSAQSNASLIQLGTVLVASLVCGPLSDRLGRRKIFVGGASLVMAVSLLIPLAMPTLTGFYLSQAVLGAGYGVYMSLDMALMSEVLPSQQDAGKDMGLLNIATNVPQTLGPTLAGLIITVFASGADKVPGYRMLFILGAVLVTLGAVLIRPIKGVR